jgi:hypothetical protein
MVTTVTAAAMRRAKRMGGTPSRICGIRTLMTSATAAMNSAPARPAQAAVARRARTET